LRKPKKKEEETDDFDYYFHSQNAPNKEKPPKVFIFSYNKKIIYPKFKAECNQNE